MLSRYNELEERLAAKAAQGLSRLLAHLCEEDERLAAAALEALKPVGVPVRTTHAKLPYASLLVGRCCNRGSQARRRASEHPSALLALQFTEHVIC